MNKKEKQTFFDETRSFINETQLMGQQEGINTIFFWMLLNAQYHWDEGEFMESGKWHFIHVRSSELLETINNLYDGYSEN